MTAPKLLLALLTLAMFPAATTAQVNPLPEALALPAHEALQAHQELPELPQVPERHERWVSMLTRVAQSSLRCEESYGDREGEYYENERCYEYFEILSESHSAGVHAMGQLIISLLQSGETEFDAEQMRMIQLMGSSRREVAAPYLLHILSHGEGAHFSAADRALSRLTNTTVSPRANWQPSLDFEDAAVRLELGRRWLSWFREYGEADLTAWQRTGNEAAERALEEQDSGVRMWAIQHLVNRNGAPQAIAALRRLIADPEVSSEARQYASRYARRNGLIRRAEVQNLVRQARSGAT